MITASALVDIGFVALVMLLAYRVLFANAGTPEQRSELWKVELKELERVLRDLIGEASVASNNLDRSLVRRKRELETLVGQLDEMEKTARGRASSNGPLATEFDDDLPNETWKESRIQKAVTPKVELKESFGPDDFQENPHLEDPLLEDPIQEDSTLQPAVQGGSLGFGRAAYAVQQTQRRSGFQKAAKSQQKPAVRKATANLAPSVEVEAEEIDTIFERTAIMDKSTYLIARRLLAEGKEIHVVSRKLELPLSEVRLLDKLMREEQGETGEQIAHKQGEFSAPITRHRPSAASNTNSLGIQRDMALL